MYEKFYGLKESPFQIVPNPAYLYKSVTHKRALTHLDYGLTQNLGFILLTGEIGSGKTTLIKYIQNHFGENTEGAVIFNTNVSANELLEMVLVAFGLSFESGYKARALNTLYHFLIDKYAAAKRILLIIDEAQNLQAEALEEIRMLSNLQTADQSLLQMMLVGQPELIQKLRQPSLQQFAQRIAVRYHLTGLNREETGEYIAFRLSKAGGSPDLFEPEAIDLIYDLSKGIPRSINVACEAAMVYGLADRAEVIGKDIVRQIIKDDFGVGLETRTQDRSAQGIAMPDMEHKNGLRKQIELLQQQIYDLNMLLMNRMKAWDEQRENNKNGQ
ncbi:MAG: AAA family ATPase [Desulfatiglandaceae bacterium]